MNSQALTVFNFREFPVRVVIGEDGEPRWIAKDTCEVLGINQYRHALERLDESERCVVRVHTLGGDQEMAAINEPGLYRFIMRSDKPYAVQFQMWITHEVLPAIRKTGSYSVDGRRKLAPGSLDLDLIRQKIAIGEEQKYLWNADLKNNRKLERKALRPLPEPKPKVLPEPKPVKALPAPRATIDDVVMHVLICRMDPGEMLNSRKISQKGAMTLREAGSEAVRFILDELYTQETVRRIGTGRSALYGLRFRPEMYTCPVCNKITQ
jgi:prophage antirepressor-like protein